MRAFMDAVVICRGEHLITTGTDVKSTDASLVCSAGGPRLFWSLRAASPPRSPPQGCGDQSHARREQRPGNGPTLGVIFVVQPGQVELGVLRLDHHLFS
jgi:hypothetical protein